MHFERSERVNEEAFVVKEHDFGYLIIFNERFDFADRSAKLIKFDRLDFLAVICISFSFV